MLSFPCGQTLESFPNPRGTANHNFCRTEHVVTVGPLYSDRWRLTFWQFNGEGAPRSSPTCGNPMGNAKQHQASRQRHNHHSLCTSVDKKGTCSCRKATKRSIQQQRQRERGRERERERERERAATAGVATFRAISNDYLHRCSAATTPGNSNHQQRPLASLTGDKHAHISLHSQPPQSSSEEQNRIMTTVTTKRSRLVGLMPVLVFLVAMSLIGGGLAWDRPVREGIIRPVGTSP